MFFKPNNNIVSRIFDRQIRTPAPGTAVNNARRFYENIVPSCTLYDFQQDHQYLIVYRPKWLSFSYKDEEEKDGCDDSHDLPSKARRFDSFFTQLYCVSLGSSNEFICNDFFLYVESNQFGLFATQTAQVYDAPNVEGAIHGVPSVEKITFHLVTFSAMILLTWLIAWVFFCMMILLAIMSVRYQTIHILQIRDSGNLVDVRAIGEFFREDDELFLNSHAQESIDNKRYMVNRAENGSILPTGYEGFFSSGIKYRLLSFIFYGIWNDETDYSLYACYTDSLTHYHDHEHLKYDGQDRPKRVISRSHLLIAVDHHHHLFLHLLTLNLHFYNFFLQWFDLYFFSEGACMMEPILYNPLSPILAITSKTE
ncbi:hypothetical protein MKW92_028574 [Papaver armeniacum]|nr:hypothetical protein MKW92_028574 [Papaver armeniacum]